MGILFLIATPIGNLADITLRALRVLKEADLIACEDTRITKKLLSHYDIKTETVSFHQHSKILKIDSLIELLKSGKKVALVTDAGTPGICDPGGLLVKEAVKNEIKIEPIPGPSALTAAISISGFKTDRFLFLGFLPHKKGKETVLKEIIAAKQVVVFYESVHRIIKTLEKLSKLGLERDLVVCRELTKKFETVYRGKARDIINQLKNEMKGEFVVIVSD